MIDCKFEDGQEVNLRHVAADTIVMSADQKQILLVKRAQTMTKEPGKWVLPGGFVDRDELVIDAARRETLEETGYELSSIEFSHISDEPNRPNDDRQNIVFYYKAVADKKVQEPDDESDEVKWFDLNQLPPKEQIGFDHYNHIEEYIS